MRMKTNDVIRFMFLVFIFQKNHLKNVHLKMC